MVIIEKTTAQLSMLAGHARSAVAPSLLAPAHRGGDAWGLGFGFGAGCNTELNLSVMLARRPESGSQSVQMSELVQTAPITGELAEGPSTADKRPGAYVGGTPPRGRETW
ncbi:hypothetical protein Lfu02_26310 [Longispora fulva]|uniref:Uncharacterized protein n=1 Tax=Longispora fulva TaxID=619741 RepID=A0A8J7GUM9_9ACTN|nr:hypothetical protein [Longispora fulva]MBG6138764.1 hypothetical protein [Longispora fulva]GIG58259.1 hypothetical protein Lfu02_26310 [Longispora fulva]